MTSRAKCSSIFLVVLFLSFVLAVQRPKLDSEGIAFLIESQAEYYGQPNALPPPPIDYSSHLGVTHPIQQQALQHAHIPGNGPFFVQHSEVSKAVYASTQVKGDSELGRRWNLRQNINGQPSNYDAQAFWRIGRAGPKLLRLQLWPATLTTKAPLMTMKEAIDSVPRGWFMCC
ncbi:related to conserved hypothetical Ustilaginaceae-specific protein [Ustilago trichophora]|uniref:Related to conserved hypothetical Ustilaginaceae-specific protein n=1 Tax=Ustilago trichophora TaxID=86804 RepID=A0A5C3EAN8_9BASI|nr:related to conserved hypothetical Ustilaginaceae-specific protein [Ustilago trichophora]